jgi:hypothetical protein
MSQLNEFGITLPISSVNAMTLGTLPSSDVPAPAPAMEPTYDMTASMEVPADVDCSTCDHISVYVDSAQMASSAANNSQVMVDLVLSVNISSSSADDPGRVNTYKLVKRLSFDKIKLAIQAEHETPVQVVENQEDPAEVTKYMGEFYAAQRARELSGLTESAGNLTAKVLFSCVDNSAAQKAADPESKIKARCSNTLMIKNVKDKAHARHVFDKKHAGKYEDPKITRVTMEA